ncbi:MAG: nucleoside deaminase [Flavobacteriia bacterium]|jgi:tRNA(adenine34) deaminase|nr:nucleoside deaminase [Cryomorphaceae bacterium]
MISPFNDEYFMRQALMEAQKAFEKDEVPVGAVVVVNNQIIARSHNFTEHLHDVTAHAEMQAITAAAENIGGKYLSGCTLYVTLEPCVMCAGALYWSQIDKVVFGARDPNRGAGRYQSELYHPKTLVTNGILEAECSALLVEFFQKKRK